MKWCSEVPRVCRQTVVTGCFSSWIHPGFILDSSNVSLRIPHWSVALIFAPARRRRSTVSKCSLQAAAKRGTWPSWLSNPEADVVLAVSSFCKFNFVNFKHIWLRLTLDQQIRCWREHPAIGSPQRCAHSAQHTAKPSGADCQKRPPLEVNHQHLHRSLWRLICNPFQQVSQLTHLALIFGEEINAFRTRISMRFG